METTASDGKLYKTNYYNLDAIISVGYRVNSSKATKFRIWATSTLWDYLTKGYVINEEKLRFEQEKVKTLQNTISLLSRSLSNQVENMKDARQVALRLHLVAAIRVEPLPPKQSRTISLTLDVSSKISYKSDTGFTVG